MNQGEWEQLIKNLLVAKESAKADKDLNQFRTLKWVLGEMNKLEQKRQPINSGGTENLRFF